MRGDVYLQPDAADASPGFTLMWTIAMVQADLAAIVAGSPHATEAARDLAVRLDGL